MGFFCVFNIPWTNFTCEEGNLLAVRRMTEPENVFGQLKNNRGFRRFLLRGIKKVTLEIGRSVKNVEQRFSNNGRIAAF
ncbi:transposase [Paenibacillus sp. MMS20-IR301]|uniref:transposase n=1 Tax=Paenibacillus sp. MMS20-IR301 TaxID=2895946 RepID=UPI0037C885BC